MTLENQLRAHYKNMNKAAETRLSAAAAAMGRKGGIARAKALSKREISEISRKAGLASAKARKQLKQVKKALGSLEHPL